MFDFMDMDFADSSALPTSTGPYIPDASECMRCGMCVSSCPTFRLLAVDEETPRRRIRTINKLLIEDQAISADEQQHLLNCLQCRACETVCPSRMAYGQLFDQALLALKRTPTRLAKWGLWLITYKKWRRRLMPVLAIYLRSGLRKPLQRSGLLRKWALAEAEALLTPPALSSLAAYYPGKNTNRGQVALFTGCIAEHFDRETLQASIRVLNAMGYEVLVPPQQVCCGAIHQHNGLPAETMMAKNMAVFNALSVEAVLYTATGCGAMLADYQSDDNQQSAHFKQRLQDINDFVLKHWPQQLNLRPLKEKAAVHEPCSQRNVLKNTTTVYALLAKIPDLQITSLADNSICCGAGGSYMLSHPDNAAKLLSMKKQVIAAAEADILVSSNFGCTTFMHTDTQKLLHPMCLLDRQL
ncbi:(Fe-S)-binding protein [Methylomonas sp. AM2-LC]|uniref:(Fe-S)-binding protein n=1 Tax=Methylomonas sp. AM2-LC TaxID=3153301 RepID=UPI0032671A0C